MKKAILVISGSAIVLFFTLAPVLLFNNGCKNPESVAYRTTGTVIVTVDTAMSAYADACRAGLIASNYQAQVHQAYDRYHAAMLVESNAVVAFKSNNDTNALRQAVAVVAASSASVIMMVQELLPADRLVKLKGTP